MSEQKEEVKVDVSKTVVEPKKDNNKTVTTTTTQTETVNKQDNRDNRDNRDK